MNVMDMDDQWLNVRLMGLVTNNASLLEWVENEISLPAILLKNADAADLFREYYGCG